MGIVIRQSFWSTLFAYFGVVVGFINTILLMPSFLSPEEIGLWQTISGMVIFISPFTLLGSTNTIQKYLPTLQGKVQSQFLSLVFLIVVATLIVFSAGAFVFLDSIKTLFEEKSPLINSYFGYTWVLLILVTFMSFLESVIRGNKEIFIPVFFREFFQKAIHVVNILLYAFYFKDINAYLIGHLVIYLLINCSLAYYIIKNRLFNISSPFSLPKAQMKEWGTFGAFVSLGVIGSTINLQVDRLMISTGLGLKEVGVYTIAVFMCTVIVLPGRFIHQTLQPILSEKFHQNKLEDIRSLFIKSVNNQTIISAFIFLAIAANTNEIFEIMPNGDIYKTGTIVILIIGFSKVLDNIFGPNILILTQSPYYRFVLVFMIALGFFNFVLNSLWIPRYGMTGAASASLVSSLTINISTSILLFKKYTFFPFQGRLFLFFLVIATAFVLLLCFPFEFQNHYFSVFIKLIILSLIFVVSLILIKPSEEIHSIINKTLILLKVK